MSKSAVDSEVGRLRLTYANVAPFPLGSPSAVSGSEGGEGIDGLFPLRG